MRGNKGEWSELYAFFKILADGRVYAADRDLNKLNHTYYDVIKVIRVLKEDFEYIKDVNIKLVNKKGAVIEQRTTQYMNQLANTILTEIKTAKTATFSIPSIEPDLAILKILNLKAKNNDKRDITIQIHDMHTNTNPILGFSIKSQLGEPPTLFNASQSSNVIYKIDSKINSNHVKNISSFKKPKDILYYLEHHNINIEFEKMENATFQTNLLMMDFGLPLIYSEMLKLYFSRQDNKGNSLSARINDITSGLCHNDPLVISPKIKDANAFYSYKIKEMLTNMALGVTASNAWNGLYDATGGYLIVKTDGEVLCYHIYQRNEFREYLFENTKFDTPSMTRNKFGEIYEENGQYYIKLNAQVRFTK